VVGGANPIAKFIDCDDHGLVLPTHSSILWWLWWFLAFAWHFDLLVVNWSSSLRSVKPFRWTSALQAFS
jgi:hypothetical protein